MTRENQILFESGKFWVSNEGTAKKPNFHVWITGITHSTCDSAYNDLSLAIARAKYLSANYKEGVGWKYIPYQKPTPFTQTKNL